MSHHRVLRLHETVSLHAPIDGVSVDVVDGTVRGAVHLRPEATPSQRLAAQAAVAAFDWSDAAHARWEEDRQRRETLERKTPRTPEDRHVMAVGMTLLYFHNVLRSLVNPPLPALTADEFWREWEFRVNHPTAPVAPPAPTPRPK